MNKRGFHFSARERGLARVNASRRGAGLNAEPYHRMLDKNECVHRGGGRGGGYLRVTTNSNGVALDSAPIATTSHHGFPEGR